MQGKGEGIIHGRKVTSMPACLQDQTQLYNYVHTFRARTGKKNNKINIALVLYLRMKEEV